MDELPDDVAASLVRGIGAYLSDTAPQELPAKLRRYRGFRPQGLQRHRKALLGALEDEGLRGRIVEWLDEAKVSLPKRDAQVLRLATARHEGWEAELASTSTRSKKPTRKSRSRTEILEEQLARERKRAGETKEEARRLKEETRLARQSWRDAERELNRQLGDAVKQAKRAEEEARKLRAASDAAATASERNLRRARRDAERATAAQADLRSQLKRERRRVADLEGRVTSLKDELAAERRRRKAASEPQSRTVSRAREPLPVPQGLLEDVPETLDAWLSESNALLLVDGYNVTKSRGGFGDLELKGQRERLIQEVRRLALKKKTSATIVFDGSEVPPGTARRTRGPVKVVYSKPGESGDDRLIAFLESLPGDPVVVVTSDRELQERARELRANVATAGQLLELLRPRG